MTKAIKRINDQFIRFRNKFPCILIEHKKVLGEKYNNPLYTAVYYELLTDGMVRGNLWKDVLSENPNTLIYMDGEVAILAIHFLKYIQKTYKPFNKRDLEACIIELSNIANEIKRRECHE